MNFATDDLTEDILTIFATAQRSVTFAPYTNNGVSELPVGFLIFDPDEKKALESIKRKKNPEKYRSADRKRYLENPVRRMLMSTYAKSDRRKQMDRERYLRNKADKCENQKLAQ